MRKQRADEIAALMGDEPMEIADIARRLKAQHPKQTLKKLNDRARATLTYFPERFEQLSPNFFQVRRTSVSYGKWESKTAFIRAHLHRTPQETIALAATYGMTLPTSTVYAIRSVAKKSASQDTTSEGVRAKTKALPSTTVVTPPSVTDGTLDQMIITLLEQELARTKMKEQVSLIVRARVKSLATERIEAIIRDTAQEEVKAFFANF